MKNRKQIEGTFKIEGSMNTFKWTKHIINYSYV